MVRQMPGAIWRPVSYRTEARPWSHTPYGWLLHITVMNGSPFDVFQRAVSPNRRFSHLWVAKNGTIEGYQDLDLTSWAQSAGNPDYYSVETEGYVNEPLTDAQITSLARIHNFLGAADAVINTPGARGIGTHVMGGAAYGNHDCPGAIRAGQRQAIINRAVQLRSGSSGGDDEMTPAELEAHAQRTSDLVLQKIMGFDPPGGDAMNVQTILGRLYPQEIENTQRITALADSVNAVRAAVAAADANDVIDVNALARGLVAALPGQVVEGVDASEFATAMAQEMSKRLAQ